MRRAGQMGPLSWGFLGKCLARGLAHGTHSGNVGRNVSLLDAELLVEKHSAVPAGNAQVLWSSLSLFQVIMGHDLPNGGIDIRDLPRPVVQGLEGCAAPGLESGRLVLAPALLFPWADPVSEPQAPHL